MRLLLVILTLSASGVVCAQDATQMTLTELVAAANSRSPIESIPFLEEIVKRAPSLKDPTALQSVQQVRLQLSRVYAQLEQWDNAMSYARSYLSQESCADRVGGLGVLCQVLFIKEDWAGLKNAAQDLMDDPAKGSDDRERAELFLAQAHFHLGEYVAALKYVDLALQWADDPDMVTSLRLMRMRSLFEAGQGERVLAGLSDITRGDSRFDINLNLFLIRMGDELFDKNSFRNALAVYRMVVPKPELTGWQEKLLAQLEEEKAQKEEKLEKTERTDEEKAEALADGGRLDAKWHFVGQLHGRHNV